MSDAGPLAFVEDWNSAAADPLDAKMQDFDWDGLFDALGESEPDASDFEDCDYEAMSHVLRTILRWVLKPSPRNPKCQRLITARVLGLALVIAPDSVREKWSLRKLSREIGAHQVASRLRRGNGRKKAGDAI